MSVSADVIDALKAARNGLSDYAAAPIIGVSQQMISQIRNNRSHLSPEKILLTCEMAGIDSVEWLLKYHRERAKCDKEKAVYDTLLRRLVA